MTRCGQSATFVEFSNAGALAGTFVFYNSTGLYSKEAAGWIAPKPCPLPDQEGCHPMKHCQPPLAATINRKYHRNFECNCARRTRAVFWCWISGFFRDGDLLCGKRAVRSVPEKAGRRKFYGGPMYVMEQLLHNRLLAVLFSVFTVLAALCVGSGVQAHSLTAAISRRLPVSVHWIGIAAALLAGSILIGGAKKRRRFVPAWFR